MLLFMVVKWMRLLAQMCWIRVNEVLFVGILPKNQATVTETRNSISMMRSRTI
jgi:hypothetical protein